MNCFAKSKKFLPHSVIMQSYMPVRGQVTELDRVVKILLTYQG